MLLSMTRKLMGCLSDLATTNVCKVISSCRNWIEIRRWMKWLVTRHKHKKHPQTWIHLKNGLSDLGTQRILHRSESDLLIFVINGLNRVLEVEQANGRLVAPIRYSTLNAIHKWSHLINLHVSIYPWAKLMHLRPFASPHKSHILMRPGHTIFMKYYYTALPICPQGSLLH